MCELINGFPNYEIRLTGKSNGQPYIYDLTKKCEARFNYSGGTKSYNLVQNNNVMRYPLKKAVVDYFIHNPSNHRYIGFKDGDTSNFKLQNLLLYSKPSEHKPTIACQNYYDDWKNPVPLVKG